MNEHFYYQLVFPSQRKAAPHQSSHLLTDSVTLFI